MAHVLALLLWLAAASVVRAQSKDTFAESHAIAADDVAPTVAEDRPSAEAQDAYFKVVRTAIAEFDGGRFAEARALFARAHELWPSARTWRTLGMTAFELSLYPHAQAELQRALDDPRRPLGDEQRTQVRTLLEQTRAFVGRYRIALTPRDAVLRLDGAPLSLAEHESVLLAVGLHELHAHAPGFTDVRAQVVVLGREDQVLEFALEATGQSSLQAGQRMSADSVPSATVATAGRATAMDGLHTGADHAFRRNVAQWSVLGSAAALVSSGASVLAMGVRARAVARSPAGEPISYAEWRDKRDRYPRLMGAGGALLGVGGVVLASGLWWKLSTRGSSGFQVAITGRALFMRGRF